MSPVPLRSGSPSGRHTEHVAPETSGIRLLEPPPSTDRLPTAETPALRSSRRLETPGRSRRGQFCPHSRTLLPPDPSVEADRIMTIDPRRKSDHRSIAKNAGSVTTIKCNSRVIHKDKLQLMSYVVASWPSSKTALPLPRKEGAHGRLGTGGSGGGSLPDGGGDVRSARKEQAPRRSGALGSRTPAQAATGNRPETSRTATRSITRHIDRVPSQ